MMATQSPNGDNMNFWDRAKVVGKRASIVGEKAKLRTDIVMIGQKIKNRQHEFGVELFDIFEQCATHDPMFVIESPSLEHIQGLFVTSFKDVCAIKQKQEFLKEKLVPLAEERKKLNSRHGGTISYEVPADTFGEKMIRAPAFARIAGQETKIKASMANNEKDILRHKQQFGIDCYDLLVRLEQFDQWLPTDQTVFSVYNAARRDIAQWQLMKEEKFEDIDVLDEEK